MTNHKLFEKIDYTVNPLIKGEYENCTFTNCNFHNADLSGISFAECNFEGCDFSMANSKNTAFKDVKFKDCKLLGFRFDECSSFLLSVDFENCILRLAVFYKLKLKKTRFKNCNLQEADFAETDLSNSTFDNCDLQRALFLGTVLEKTDFRTSYNFSINPETNRIKKARFSKLGALGLLDKYNIDIE